MREMIAGALKQQAAGEALPFVTISKSANQVVGSTRYLAIDRAKREGMPNDTIERAIARASGANSDANSYETVIYEGYGPGGVAILAIALTDNRNRTAAEVRNAFNRNGGSLGETGSVAWQFDTVGQIVIPVNGADPDEIALVAIDAGATDVETDDDEIVITTAPGDLTSVATTLRDSGYELSDMSVTRLPQTPVDLAPNQASTALRLLETLEELDDVNEVYTNANFSEEVVAV